jgi:hypothetical protein
MPPSVSAGLFANETVWRLGRHISVFSAGCQEFFCWKFWARSTDSKVTKGENMKDQRVLIRKGARELTPTETELINGGFRTLSFCTGAPSPDGDQHVGEVGC